MNDMDALMEQTASLHGHVCPGQVLGVRMAVLGCARVGVDEPTRSKDLIVYVEIDRCMTDAVQAVTGCKLGKRTLKFKDYGKVAATFVNTTSKTAFRVVARDDSRELVSKYASEGMAKSEAQAYAYRKMSDDELFEVMQAKLDVRELTAVGSPIAMVQCLSERSHANIGSMAMRPCAAELMDAHSRCSYIRANATSWSGRKCAKSAQTSP